MGTHYEGTDEEKKALNLFITLNRAADSVMNATKDIYTQAGLTHTQFAVMELLYHLGPLSQMEVSRKVLKTCGNITMVMSNLEKKGYVIRQKSSEDRRAFVNRLSDEGRQIIERIFPVHVSEILKIMSALEPREQEQLYRLCQKLGRSHTST